MTKQVPVLEDSGVTWKWWLTLDETLPFRAGSGEGRCEQSPELVGDGSSGDPCARPAWTSPPAPRSCARRSGLLGGTGQGRGIGRA